MTFWGGSDTGDHVLSWICNGPHVEKKLHGLTDLTRKIEAAALHEHGPPTGMHLFEGLLDSCVTVEV